MKDTGKTLFRSDVARGVKDGKKGVDREKGAIYSFAVISKGEASGHGMEIDDIALEQIVELGNKTKIGVKSRFGHPNMSNTALGTFLGRVKNFWKDGDVVRGDIHFDKSAYKTPNGDLASYVMDLAENDPDAFGTSIVWDGELEERLNKDGTRKKDEKTGEVLLLLVRFKKLLGVDTVDNPAANNGMFGTFFNEDVQISAEMTAFLDKFLNDSDAVEKTMTFLQRYATNALEEKFDCECIKCGHKETYEDHCNEHKCSECGGQMRRAERPGPGQEKQNETKEVKKEMELSELTLEMLKKERSDLAEQLLEEGKESGKKESLEAGVEQERKRTLSILQEAKGFEGMEDLAKEAIEKGDSLEVAVGKFKVKKSADLQAASPKSTGPSDNPDDEIKLEGLKGEELYKAEWKKDAKLTDEFTSETAYIAFRKAQDRGAVKIMSK